VNERLQQNGLQHKSGRGYAAANIVHGRSRAQLVGRGCLLAFLPGKRQFLDRFDDLAPQLTGADVTTGKQILGTAVGARGRALAVLVNE
jgi:hypothetical protein